MFIEDWSNDKVTNQWFPLPQSMIDDIMSKIMSKMYCLSELVNEYLLGSILYTLPFLSDSQVSTLPTSCMMSKDTAKESDSPLAGDPSRHEQPVFDPSERQPTSNRIYLEVIFKLICLVLLLLSYFLSQYDKYFKLPKQTWPQLMQQIHHILFPGWSHRRSRYHLDRLWSLDWIRYFGTFVPCDVSEILLLAGV